MRTASLRLGHDTQLTSRGRWCRGPDGPGKRPQQLRQGPHRARSRRHNTQHRAPGASIQTTEQRADTGFCGSHASGPTGLTAHRLRGRAIPRASGGSALSRAEEAVSRASSAGGGRGKPGDRHCPASRLTRSNAWESHGVGRWRQRGGTVSHKHQLTSDKEPRPLRGAKTDTSPHGPEPHARNGEMNQTQTSPPSRERTQTGSQAPM